MSDNPSDLNNVYSMHSSGPSSTPSVPVNNKKKTLEAVKIWRWATKTEEESSSSKKQKSIN